MAAPASSWVASRDCVGLLRRAADLTPDDSGFLGPLPALYLALGMRAEAEATSRD